MTHQDYIKEAINAAHDMTVADLIETINRASAGKDVSDTEVIIVQVVTTIMDHGGNMEVMAKTKGIDITGMTDLEIACHIAARKS